ncbi:hypothetical protein F4818DRAFT_445688 [Hypoxylon cercidicola]|nr:hypothetical protein F4818DRAFT_445688 [Hypoxylon cercidicola]
MNSTDNQVVSAKSRAWDGDIVHGDDPYVLQRESNSSARWDSSSTYVMYIWTSSNTGLRLTAQHYLRKDLLGFLVHPGIPTAATDLKIADVATENGISMHDMSRDKPTAELHGFDISLDQAGPKPWLPANIRMHTWDIFKEPPERFVGYFDIMHVRLVTVVVKNNDPRPMLANLTKLLKPGGYLKWDEFDSIGCSVKAVTGRSENLDGLFSHVRGRDTYVSAWKELAHTLKTPEASREMEQRAMDEARNGAAFNVGVGRKKDFSDHSRNNEEKMYFNKRKGNVQMVFGPKPGQHPSRHHRSSHQGSSRHGSINYESSRHSNHSGYHDRDDGRNREPPRATHLPPVPEAIAAYQDNWEDDPPSQRSEVIEPHPQYGNFTMRSAMAAANTVPPAVPAPPPAAATSPIIIAAEPRNYNSYTTSSAYASSRSAGGSGCKKEKDAYWDSGDHRGRQTFHYDDEKRHRRRK